VYILERLIASSVMFGDDTLIRERYFG